MATFKVTFTAEVEVEVEVDDEQDARRTARQQLDPDVDWEYLKTVTSEEEEYFG